MTSHRWLTRPFEAVARRQIRSQIDDPELRRKVTPGTRSAASGSCSPTTGTPTLTKPNVELVTDRIETVTPRAGCEPPTGSSARPTSLILGTGFRTHGFVAPMDVRGPGWTHARGGLGRSAEGLPRHHRARLPEHVPALRAQHQRRRGLGDLHGRGGHAARDRAIRELERANARTIELRPQAAAEFDRELREALAGTVWHSGCTQLVRGRARHRPEPVAVGLEPAIAAARRRWTPRPTSSSRSRRSGGS